MAEPTPPRYVTATVVRPLGTPVPLGGFVHEIRQRCS